MKFQVGVTKPVVEPASELASLVPLRALPIFLLFRVSSFFHASNFAPLSFSSIDEFFPVFTPVSYIYPSF